MLPRLTTPQTPVVTDEPEPPRAAQETFVAWFVVCIAVMLGLLLIVQRLGM